MDNDLFSRVYERTPKFNPLVANNICYELMNHVEQLIVDTFTASQTDYPPALRFVRLERVDPNTEYTHGDWTRDTRDISKNTIYMVKLVFEFDGKPIKPFYLYLPYCYKGGIMVIGGSTFVLNGALIDPCFSVTENTIFIHTNKDKQTFMSVIYHYNENGSRVNENVTYSTIYRGGDKKSSGGTYVGHRTRSMKHVTALYLFSHYGLTKTFEKCAGVTDMVIGYEDITTEFYPPEDWTICTTVGLKPITYQSRVYEPVKIALAIPNAQMTEETRLLLAAFFYVADHFPEFFTSMEVDDPAFYRRLLARMILPYQADQLISYRDTGKHLVSLHSLIDFRTTHKFKVVEGIDIHDAFDLFAEMVLKFDQRFTQTVDELTTMYGKRVVLLDYLLKDIIFSINNLGYDFQSIKNDASFTAQKAEEKIKNRIKPLTIIGIKSGHKEISSLQIACDNMIAKVSSPVVLQSRMGNNTDKNVSLTLDMTLSASIAEVGNVTCTAGDKTGRSRLNMFTHIGSDGYILRNPELIDIVDNTQAQIRR